MKAERAEAAQPGEEKALRNLIAASQQLDVVSKKDGGKLFSRVCSNKPRSNGFKLTEVDSD